MDVAQGRSGERGRTRGTRKSRQPQAMAMVPFVQSKMDGGSLPVWSRSKQAEGTAADVHHCEWAHEAGAARTQRARRGRVARNTKSFNASEPETLRAQVRSALGQPSRRSRRSRQGISRRYGAHRAGAVAQAHVLGLDGAAGARQKTKARDSEAWKHTARRARTNSLRHASPSGVAHSACRETVLSGAASKKLASTGARRKLNVPAIATSHWQYPSSWANTAATKASTTSSTAAAKERRCWAIASCLSELGRECQVGQRRRHLEARAEQPQVALATVAVRPAGERQAAQGEGAARGGIRQPALCVGSRVCWEHAHCEARVVQCFEASRPHPNGRLDAAGSSSGTLAPEAGSWGRGKGVRTASPPCLQLVL